MNRVLMLSSRLVGLFTGQKPISTLSEFFVSPLTASLSSEGSRIQMDSLPPPVDWTSKGSTVLEDGIAQDLVNLTTGKSPTVLLVDGIVQDPRQQREVNAETNVHAPVTKKSVNLWRGKKCIKFKLRRGKKSKKLFRGNTFDMVTPKEEAQRLVFENRKLMEQICELCTLNLKVNDKIAELLEQYSAQWKRGANRYNQLADIVRKMAGLAGKISTVLEDEIPQDPKQQSEVRWFMYKVGDTETDGHVPVTERLSRSSILHMDHMVTIEETHQLILENGELNKQVIELRNLNAMAHDKLSELRRKNFEEQKNFTQQFLKLDEERARLATEFLELVKERDRIFKESYRKFVGEGLCSKK